MEFRRVLFRSSHPAKSRHHNALTCQEEICRAHYSLKRRLSSPVSAVKEKLGKSIIHRDDRKPQTPLLLQSPQPSDPGCSLFTGPYDFLRKPFSFLICGNRKFSTIIDKDVRIQP